ncbi:replication protein A 32 kDa subunit B-like [Triticum dicoccoides]|uniref:replication protein A 32 kDa subunit B-like n=1 Tax=Triticum dicoccoides TaxID=85692 RepID=UPI000E79AB90|nr:replication protein A 32 kDa subunit B-like [Triticum dicoccoides]XP_037427925.1 replication protein A 32 kDa subunit B-like [Triticum dicoccoides]XP_037427926.1 replication protein A 32 kDa subunit B-like [Triticum dicoccoides]
MKGRFVGVMQNRRDLDSEIIFDFDDGTGRVKARIWTVESEFLRSMDTAKDGEYIVLNGGIRGGTHGVHIRVYPVRIATNYNDITHHFLSCIYVHLDLRKQARLRHADRDRREAASLLQSTVFQCIVAATLCLTLCFGSSIGLG